jgi:hypothetical protein
MNPMEACDAVARAKRVARISSRKAAYCACRPSICTFIFVGIFAGIFAVIFVGAFLAVIAYFVQ